MLRDTATCEANYRRFLERTIEAAEAWTLSSASGVAICESNDTEASVILFFSDAAYARRAQVQFPDHQPERLDLFDLLYRWLPGMSGDGVLAGPNWTGDLAGLEIDPLVMREALEAALQPEQQTAFRARYAEPRVTDQIAPPNHALQRTAPQRQGSCGTHPGQHPPLHPRTHRAGAVPLLRGR